MIYDAVKNIVIAIMAIASAFIAVSVLCAAWLVVQFMWSQGVLAGMFVTSIFVVILGTIALIVMDEI